MNKFLSLASIKNFRDFGGYDADGGRIKTGLLLRSGHHSETTDEDLAALAALNIATIVDLRNSTERAERPSRRWENFAACVIENDHHGETQAEKEFGGKFSAYLDSAELSVDGLAGWSLDWYLGALLQPRHLDLYTRYFDALAEGRGPILIHCSRGKDRTGLLAALTHHIAGVSDDDILADYLLANGMTPSPVDLAHRTDVSDEVRRALVDLRAEFLHGAFAQISARHGSLDGYLNDALGVDADKRAAIRAHILV